MLWAGLLAPPLIWLTLLETNYVLAYAACEARQTWFLLVAVVLSLAAAAAVGLAAWKSGPAGGGAERSAPWSIRTREIRVRWMSLAGVAFTAWFLVAMLAMSLPPIVLRPCD